MVELDDNLGGIEDQNFMGFIKRLNDGIGIKGLVANIKHYVPDDNGDFEKDGIRYRLEEDKTIENTLCDLGNSMAARRFFSAAETMLPTHMAVGSGDGSKTSASTTLTTELGRVALDSLTCPAAGAANDNVVTAVATFGAGVGTGALVEAGLFTGTPAGTMICFSQYGIVTKAAADIVIFTWTITFGTT